jgi:hypothetical protein
MPLCPASHRRRKRLAPILLMVALSPHAVRAQTPVAEPRPMKEIYQDFRNGTPLQSVFRLLVPADANTVVKPEPEGLRVTLPATRPKHFPVEIRGTFSLFGDFDVTGTYELLSAAEPAEGYGVGVALIVADSDKRNKFVKVGRLMRPQIGSVYYSEFWTREPPRDFQARSQPTKVRAGQLRLSRDGARLRCLVADEVGKDFMVIQELPNFGAEELSHLTFEVADGNSPNNPVDARLVDLRARMETLPPDKGAGPSQLPPIVTDDAVAEVSRPASSGWRAALLGLVFAVLLAGAVTLFFWARQRDAARKG